MSDRSIRRALLNSRPRELYAELPQVRFAWNGPADGSGAVYYRISLAADESAAALAATGSSRHTLSATASGRIKRAMRRLCTKPSAGACRLKPIDAGFRSEHARPPGMLGYIQPWNFVRTAESARLPFAPIAGRGSGVAALLHHVKI